MSHSHILIVGTSGSGKTSLARQLVQLTPRAVIIDPQGDYSNDPGVESCNTFAGFGSRLIALQDAPGGTWRLAYTPDAGHAADGGFRAVMALTYRARMEARDKLGAMPPPIGVFLEEASIYSDASRTPPELDWLVRAGRKAAINTVSVVQGDVDISKSVRRNMTLTVLFRTHDPSTDLVRKADRSKLAKLETLHGPGEAPEEGVHFLTFPPGIDPHRAWSEAVTD